MAVVSSPNFVLHPDVQTLQCFPPQAAPSKWANSIHTLIERLNTSPFIVGAHLGPQVYTEDPFPAGTINGTPIYGWKPNSSRVETTPKCFFVLGAQESDGKELVFYACAQHDSYAPGNYRRFPQDQKIYVVSLKRFQKCVTSFAFPPVPKPPLPTQKVELTSEETVWFDRFLEFPIETTLGERKGECKALAQEAFDTFKKQFHGDSLLARDALVHICEAMRNSSATREYYGNLERAWDGVGDETFRWQG